MEIDELLLATSNPGKIAEMRRIMEKRGIGVTTPVDLGINIDVDEDQETLEGNAVKKARTLNAATGVPCLADDTGLEVTALGGRPGVHSARYAGPDNDAIRNRQKLLTELVGADDRSARFRTVVALVDGDTCKTFEGTCEGFILTREVGDQGFGYDSLFMPAGSERSFAEMSVEEKNKISHRSRAMNRFIEYLDEVSN